MILLRLIDRTIIFSVTNNMDSTMLQLLHMLDKWTEYLENGGQIDVIYSDFEKAFDKVLHRRLLSGILWSLMTQIYCNMP